jgi:D-alanyl-D-alanine carboxypeptidase (penicillin-binding protein 5/6)
MAQPLTYRYLFTFALVLTLMLVASTAQAVSSIIPAPPQIAARAHLVMDADTGYIIAANRNREGQHFSE